MRVKNQIEQECRKCGKLIKKHRQVSLDGWCFRCDENRMLKAMHLQEWRERKNIEHLRILGGKYG